MIEARESAEDQSVQVPEVLAVFHILGLRGTG